MSAHYTINEVAEGIFVAYTTVTWDRNYGRCKRHTVTKNGVYHTKSELKKWATRNKIEVDPMDLDFLVN